MKHLKYFKNSQHYYEIDIFDFDENEVIPLSSSEKQVLVNIDNIFIDTETDSLWSRDTFIFYYKSITVEVMKFPDEWFVVSFSSWVNTSKNQQRYDCDFWKCDQFDSVLKILNELLFSK